jgi:hypothetical protein
MTVFFTDTAVKTSILIYDKQFQDLNNFLFLWIFKFLGINWCLLFLYTEFKHKIVSQTLDLILCTGFYGFGLKLYFSILLHVTCTCRVFGCICTDTQQQKEEWAIITYNRKGTRKITGLFEDANIKIPFKTKSTIQNILKSQAQIDKYVKKGVYKMKCMCCPLKCVGQMGRSFIRYREHVWDIKNSSSNSGYFARYWMKVIHMGV